MRLHLVRDICNRPTAGVQGVLRYLLVREIDRGFDPRRRTDQLPTPFFVKLAEASPELADRLPALSLRFGIDQIRDRFSLGQVQLAVLDRPAREFARLGHPEP